MEFGYCTKISSCRDRMRDVVLCPNYSHEGRISDVWADDDEKGNVATASAVVGGIVENLVVFS